MQVKFLFFVIVLMYFVRFNSAFHIPNKEEFDAWGRKTFAPERKPEDFIIGPYGERKRKPTFEDKVNAWGRSIAPRPKPEDYIRGPYGERKLKPTAMSEFNDKLIGWLTQKLRG